MMALTTLKTRADYLRVRGGQRWSSAGFLMEAKQRPDGARAAGVGPRFGFTVTKKMGNAVHRNRIRRRLKAVVAAVINGAQDDFDYVIVARRAALNRSFQELINDFKTALKRVHEVRGGGAVRQRARANPVEP